MQRRGNRVAERHTRSGERGTALVVALLVMVIMTLLGIPFLLMGETENRIAENERLSLQALYAAEAGAQTVKRWFDQPMSTSNVLNPPLAVIDRALRLIDADGDPGTAPVLADGSAGQPFYKQADDAVFAAPYRGSLADALLGTEDGPDMSIDVASGSAAKTFLGDLSDKLFAGYLGSGRRARINRIDVYAPPTLEKSGSWVRYGVATAKVTAGIYEDIPGEAERVLAERTVKIVLNEIPYGSTVSGLGPLHSCGDVVWNGEFAVHWGTATIDGDAYLSSDHTHHTVSFPRVPSPSEDDDLYWGNASQFDAYRTEIDGSWIEDPWFRLLVSGSVDIAPNTDDQPWPFDWDAITPLVDGQFPHHADDGSYDGTHSNYFQNVPYVDCPTFSYETWKAIAMSGAQNTHYYVWDECDKFMKDGVGPSRRFKDITDGQTGLFFFDTADQLPPRDDDGDGEFDNLTPYTINLTTGSWGFRGMLYLNAEEFRVDGPLGMDGVPFEPPGELYRDTNGDGTWEYGEPHVNLIYPTSLTDYGAQFGVDKNDCYEGHKGRNDRGKPITERANMWGVFYTNGWVGTNGIAAYYGSVVARQGMKDIGSCSESPHFIWDQTLAENWPPASWEMPRIFVSRWETDL
jgi:hypothetical protein